MYLIQLLLSALCLTEAARNGPFSYEASASADGYAATTVAQCAPKPDSRYKTWYPKLVPEVSGLNLVSGTPLLTMFIRGDQNYHVIDKANVGYSQAGTPLQGDSTTTLDSPSFTYPDCGTNEPDVEKKIFISSQLSDGTPCEYMYQINIAYTTLCNFDVDENFVRDDGVEVIKLSGSMIVKALLPQILLGQQIEQEYERPIQFRIELPKTVNVETTIKVQNQCQCNEDSDCGTGTCGPLNGLAKCQCVCPSCYQGLTCEQYTCAPAVTCPSDITVHACDSADGVFQYDNANMHDQLSAVSFVATTPDSIANLRVERSLNGGAFSIVSPTSSTTPTGVDFTDNLSSETTYFNQLGSTHKIQYTVINTVSAASDTCTITLTVDDKCSPTLICPANISWAYLEELPPVPALPTTFLTPSDVPSGFSAFFSVAPAGFSTITSAIAYYFNGMSASDGLNSKVAIAGTISPASSSPAAAGEYTINYCLYDIYGNGPSCCDQRIQIDRVVPEVTCTEKTYPVNHAVEIDLTDLYTASDAHSGIARATSGTGTLVVDQPTSFVITVVDNAGNSVSTTCTAYWETPSPSESPVPSTSPSASEPEPSASPSESVEPSPSPSASASDPYSCPLGTQSQINFTLPYILTQTQNTFASKYWLPSVNTDHTFIYDTTFTNSFTTLAGYGKFNAEIGNYPVPGLNPSKSFMVTKQKPAQIEVHLQTATIYGDSENFANRFQMAWILRDPRGSVNLNPSGYTITVTSSDPSCKKANCGIYNLFHSASGTFPKGYSRGDMGLSEFDNTVQTRILTVTLSISGTVIESKQVTVTLGALPSVYPTYQATADLVTPRPDGTGPYLFAELPKYPVYPGQTFTVYLFYSTGKNPSGTQYNLNGGSFNLLSEASALTFLSVDYNTNQAKWGTHKRPAYFTSNGNILSANTDEGKNVRTVSFKTSSYYTLKTQTIGYYLPLMSISFKANSGLAASVNSLNGISVQLTTDNMASESNSYSFGTNIPIMFSDIENTPYNDVGKVRIRKQAPLGIYPLLSGSLQHVLLDTNRISGSCTAALPTCETRVITNQFWDCIKEVAWDSQVGVTSCSAAEPHLITSTQGSGSTAYCNIQASSTTGIDQVKVDISVAGFTQPTWAGFTVYTLVSGSLQSTVTRSTLRRFAYDNTWETALVSVTGSLTSGPDGQTHTDLDLTNLITFAVPAALTYNTRHIVGVANGPNTGEATYTLSSAASGLSMDFVVKSDTTTIRKVTAFTFSSLSVSPTFNQNVNEGDTKTASITPKLSITKVGQEAQVVVFAEHEDGQYSDVSDIATVTSLQPADIDMKIVNGVHTAYVPYGAQSLRCDIWLKVCVKGVCGDGVLFTQLPHPTEQTIIATNNVVPYQSAAWYPPINGPRCTNLQITMTYSDGSTQDFTYSPFTTLFTDASGYFVQDYSSKTQFCTNTDTALGNVVISVHFPTMNEGASRADHLPPQSTTIKVYDVYKIEPQLNYHLPMKAAAISTLSQPGTLRIVHCTPKYQMGVMKTTAFLTDGCPVCVVDVSSNTGYTEDIGGAATDTTVSGVHTYVQGVQNGQVSFTASFPREQKLISQSGLIVNVDDSTPLHVSTIVLQYGGSANTYTLSGTGRLGPGAPTTQGASRLQYNFDDGSYLYPLTQFASTVPTGLSGEMPHLVDFQSDDETRVQVGIYTGVLTLVANSYVDNTITVKAVCDAKITDSSKVKEGSALVDANLYPALWDSKIGYTNLLTYRAGASSIDVPVYCQVGSNFMAACQVAISIDTRFIDWNKFLTYMGKTGGTCGTRTQYCISNPNGFGVNFVLGSDSSYIPTFYEGSTAQGEFIQIQVSDSTVTKTGNVQLCTLKFPLLSGVAGRFGLGGYVVQMRAATKAGGTSYAWDFQAAGNDPPMQPVVSGGAYVVIGGDTTLAPDVSATQLRRRMTQTVNPPPCGPFPGTGDTNGDKFVSLSDTSNIAVAAAVYASTAPNPILIYTGDIPVSCVDCLDTNLSPKFSYSSNLNSVSASFIPLLQAFVPTLHHMNPYVGVPTTGQWLPDRASSHYNQDAMVPYDDQAYGIRNYSSNNADYNFHVQAVGGVTRFLAINTPWDLINSLPTTCDNHVSLVAYINKVVQTPANTLTAAACDGGDTITFEIDIEYSNVDMSSVLGGVTITPAIDGFILVNAICTAPGVYNASFDVITPSVDYKYKVGVWVKTAISNTFSYFGVAGDLQGNTQLNPIFVGSLPAQCTASPSPSPDAPSASPSPSLAIPSASPVWCGNGEVQVEYGEECDPPSTGLCTAECKCDTGFSYVAGTGCKDSTNPVIANCPESIIVEATGSDPAYGGYSISGITASDNSIDLTWTLLYREPWNTDPNGRTVVLAGTTSGIHTFGVTMDLNHPPSGILPSDSYLFEVKVQDSAGNSDLCSWTVKIFDTTKPTLTCGTQSNINLRPLPGQNDVSMTFPTSYAYDIHDADVTTVYTWTQGGSLRSASAGDSAVFTYDTNGVNTYTVTLRATDDKTSPSLQASQACFDVIVHEPFAAEAVDAVLQRVNIFTTDNGENFYARIRYLTAVNIPFGLALNAPADLSDVFSPRTNDVLDELQHYIPVQVGDPFNCDLSSGKCFQEWTLLIHFGDCEPNDFNIDIPYNVKVADCSQAYIPSTQCNSLITGQSIVTINFRGENFCETQLQGPEIKGQLSAYTSTEIATKNFQTNYITTAQMVNYEATLTNFVPEETVTGVVTIASDAVLIEKITLLRAQHTLCDDADRTICGSPVSIVSRSTIDSNPVLGTLNGQLSSESSVFHNFATFTYKEFAPALGTTSYVKLDATVAITYLLGNTGARRRALTSFSWNPDTESRRSLLQEEEADLEEMNVDAQLSLSALAGGPTTQGVKPQDAGFMPFANLQEATGVPGIIIFFLVIMLSCCVCCGICGCIMLATKKDPEFELVKKNQATDFDNAIEMGRQRNKEDRQNHTMIYLSPALSTRSEL